jgi:hypothetical protein
MASAGPNQVADDYKARCDADARLQECMGLQIADRRHQL